MCSKLNEPSESLSFSSFIQYGTILIYNTTITLQTTNFHQYNQTILEMRRQKRETADSKTCLAPTLLRMYRETQIKQSTLFLFYSSNFDVIVGYE